MLEIVALVMFAALVALCGLVGAVLREARHICQAAQESKVAAQVARIHLERIDDGRLGRIEAFLLGQFGEDYPTGTDQHAEQVARIQLRKAERARMARLGYDAEMIRLFNAVPQEDVAAELVEAE
jgi:hypothetical protein